MSDKPTNGNANESMLSQFDRRYEQRFSDLGKANEVALTAQKEALKTASETTDKALKTAGEAVEKALVIERQSTKDKFDTLTETVKRIESQTSLLIPRGEVTEKIDGVSERVRKVEEIIVSFGGRSKGVSELGGWIFGSIMALTAVGGLLVAYLK